MTVRIPEWFTKAALQAFAALDHGQPFTDAVTPLWEAIEAREMALTQDAEHGKQG